MPNYGSGSWFGLPEMGVTERGMELISGLVGVTPDKSNYESIYSAQQSSNPSSNNNSSSNTMYGPSPTQSTSYPNQSIGSYNSGDNYSQPSDVVQNGGGSGSEPSFKDMLSSVNDQYSGMMSSMDSQIAGLGDVQNQFMGNIGNSVTAQQGLVNNSLEQGQNQLNQNTETAKQTEKSTLRTLSEDVMNMLQAGNQKLGGMGASDSSASDMLKWAIAKQGNKNTANVVGQTREILSNIENLGVELKSKAQESLLEIDQWKAEQERGIMEYVSGLKKALEAQKNNIDSSMRSQNIDAIKSQYENAKNRMQQLEDYSMQYKDNLAADYISRQRTLQDYASQLQTKANYGGGYATDAGNISGLQANAGSVNTSPVLGSYNDDEESNIFGAGGGGGIGSW